MNRRSSERRPVEPLRALERLLVAERQAERIADAAEAGRVDRADPERAVREVEAEDVVAVADDLGDDLAEAERHDREVVATQSQRRQADQDARRPP